MWALVKYFLYSIRRNKARAIDLFVWPVLEVLVFGFMASYLSSGGSQMIAILVGSLVLWHFFVRVSGEVYQQLFDEVLSKNLQNLMVTPLRTGELLAALVLGAVVKLIINMLIILAVIWAMYHWWPVSGWDFDDLAVLLIWAMALGIAIAATLFWLGNKAVAFGWVIAGVVQPFSCVFYSRAVLPPLMQGLSYLVPSSYVFENYRARLGGSGGGSYAGLALAIIYLMVAIGLFLFLVKWARKNGMMIRV